jgi:PAS domain S-box-containing protein
MLDSVLLPLHFTVEFAGFIVFAGAVLLIATRPSVVPAGRFGRGSAALGFAVLAGAQVAHGAAFVENDGDPALISARALGLAFVAIGVARAGSAWSYPGVAGAAVRIREPLALASVTAALILVFVALTRARKGIVEFRRLAFGAFWLGISEGLTGVFPHAEVGAGSVDPLVHVAHVAKLLGYASIAAWLWWSVRSSVRARFVAAFATLLLAVVLALSSTLTGVISNNVETEELNRMESQLDNSVRSIKDRDDALAETAQIIAASDTAKSAFSGDGSPSELARDIGRGPAFELDFVILAAPDGRLLEWFARREPEIDRRGDAGRRRNETTFPFSVLGSSLFDEVRSPGVPVAASIVFADGTLATVAAADVTGRRPGAGPTGVVLVGRYLDDLTVEAITNNFEPARASLVRGEDVIATSLPPRTPLENLVPDSTRRNLTAGSVESTEQELGSRPFFSAFAPLVDAVDAPVATIVLSTPADVVTATRRADVTRSLFLVALAVGAVALLLAWLSGRRITRPIQALTQAATAVREGDLTAQARVTGDDEVGQLGTTFNEMTAALIGMTDNLREAARQERELRARIETIMQSMADGLVAVDTERKVFAFNAAAEELTGVGTDEAVDRELEDVLDIRDANGETLSMVVDDRGAESVRTGYLMRREGPPLPIAVTSAVIRDVDGDAAGAVVVVRDVSREHEVERMKSEFLSNISHELRTPLTPIKGYAELLSTRELPADKSKRFAKGIRESTERLERIVELLVDFAALEAGRLSPRAQPVDLRSVIEDIVQQWKKRSDKHEFVTDIGGQPLPPVAGDERLLRRSLEEIVHNAVKFSPNGGTILIAARASEDRGSIEVVISDEGIGIPAEDLPHVFTDFHQIDSSETRSYGGLGLGLAFVQRFVEAHRGEVEVASEQQHGTTLTIRLPVGRAGAGA